MRPGNPVSRPTLVAVCSGSRARWRTCKCLLVAAAAVLRNGVSTGCCTGLGTEASGGKGSGQRGCCGVKSWKRQHACDGGRLLDVFWTQRALASVAW